MRPGNLYFYVKDPLKELTCVTTPSSQCIYTYLNDQGAPETKPMAFVWGRQRMPGQHATDINNNPGDSLPYYTKSCGSAFPGPGYILRQNLTPQPWSSDCDVSVVRESPYSAPFVSPLTGMPGRDVRSGILCQVSGSESPENPMLSVSK